MLLETLSSSHRIIPRARYSVSVSVVDKRSNTEKLLSVRYYFGRLFCQDCISDDGSSSRKRFQNWKENGRLEE